MFNHFKRRTPGRTKFNIVIAVLIGIMAIAVITTSARAVTRDRCHGLSIQAAIGYMLRTQHGTSYNDLRAQTIQSSPAHELSFQLYLVDIVYSAQSEKEAIEMVALACVLETQ